MSKHLEIGIFAQKVPLSGAVKFRNSVDIDIYPWGREGPPLVAEVKSRGDGRGFRMLETWLSDADLLVLRRDRAEPMVVLPWKSWARLLAR